SLLAAHYVGPVRLGMNRWLWWAMVAAVSTVVLLVADHFVRRLLPLTALLKMTLIFPDNAPSRFGLALRTGTTKQLERFVQQSSASGVAGKELDRAAAMLELVAALSVHDRLTRGHCERVRAYTDLIIKEMNISEREANLLRWSALLHDVGKLRVPREILTSDQPPTAKQWQVLTTHPAQGMALTATLADWLGEWRRTIGEHHERWDGNGYPARLSRDQIHLGARIVAVADAFDVMTSVRSYKKPIPAAVAREEIARCASTQFVPTVVRAFLGIGLRRLRFALGPLAWVSNLPFLGQAPVMSAASNAIGGVATASVLAVATAAGAPPVAHPPLKPTPVVQAYSFAATITAPNLDVTGNRDERLVVNLQGSAGTDVSMTLMAQPQHGEAIVSRQPSLDAAGQWTSEVLITPTAGFTGQDQLDYEVCDGDAHCAHGSVRILLVDPMVPIDPKATTTASTTTTTAAAPVVGAPQTTIDEAPTTTIAPDGPGIVETVPVVPVAPTATNAPPTTTPLPTTARSTTTTAAPTTTAPPTTTTAPPTSGNSQKLFLTAAGGGQYSFTGTSPPAVNPEPDADNDGKPGLTIARDSQNGVVWTTQLTSDTTFAGPVTIDLFSTIRNFSADRATLGAQLLVCDAGGNNCATLLQQQWTFRPWNVGAVAT
ncbi:MAG: HD domain-containing phosphohydrolase, partial [Ilumatobacteraceae bacterium]